jgi:ribosomal protein S18 acetylase RimI-like enzyme
MSAAVEFRSMSDEDVGAVIALWQTCGLTRPWNNPEKDIAFARGKPHSDILVGVIAGRVVASIMVGHDGHRGSFYYVAVEPDRQRRGTGAELIRAGEAWLKKRGVWKVNLLIRQDNAAVQGFYERLGYQVNEVMSMGQRLIED